MGANRTWGQGHPPGLVASAGRGGGPLAVVDVVGGQEHGGSSELDGGSSPRPSEIGQGLPLGIGECPERILLAAGHWRPPCRREAANRAAETDHYGHRQHE
jgi:hypothetical protein